MTNYLFLTANNEEVQTTYLAIDFERIETLNVCDTYDNYGQSVGNENAGDYHIDNQYSDAKKDCEIAVFEKFGKKVSIDASNACVDVIDETEVDEWVSENNETLINEINTFISEWCNENHNLSTCKGFNYWDGSNWKTIVTEYEYDGNETHSVLNDEELTEKLNLAIENKEFIKEGFGLATYQFEDVTIIGSQFASSFEAYSLTIN